jgi:hypothetical protein
MQDDSPRPGRSDYLDFDLEIEAGTGRDYPVAVLDSPAGCARGSMHFPFDELVLENQLLTLQNALLRSGGKPRRTLSPEQQAVRDFGQALFEALFTPEVRSCYDVSLREAARQGSATSLPAPPPSWCGRASRPWWPCNTKSPSGRGSSSRAPSTKPWPMACLSTGLWPSILLRSRKATHSTVPWKKCRL